MGHGDGSATVTWTTDEASDSWVDFGTDPGTLDRTTGDASMVTSHSVTLTGLTPGTVHFRVRSTDGAGNTATSPPTGDAPDTFTMPSAAFNDTTVADFSAGTPGADTTVVQTSDGELVLTPTVGAEFSGTALPSGWEQFEWENGGPAVVGGGTVSVDGARVNPTTLYGPGRSLEFVATFSGAPNQHVGFGTDFNDPPFVIFSTKDGNKLMARTFSGGAGDDETLLSTSLGAPHRFRIDLTGTQEIFSVDGTVVATHNRPITVDTRPIASDLVQDGGVLTVDWMRMTPYPASGTFLSRVFDAGTAPNWGGLTWNASLPAGTSLAMAARTGDTPTPDGTWSTFRTISSSGGAIGGNSRYVQYRAQLDTTDPGRTPEVQDVSVAYTPGSDETPPTVQSVTPTDAATDVARSTDVTAVFSEAMDAATIDSATFTLVPEGGSPVAATVAYDPDTMTATLNPDADLAPGTLYTATTTTTAADLAGNHLQADHTWSFTTAAASFTDTTVEDFTAGTPGTTYVGDAAGGEVILTPTVGAEFLGSALPSGWEQVAWSGGGAATVAGGSLSVEGARANPTASYGPGSSLEFVATFTTDPFQTVGFGVDFNVLPFSAFGTRNGNELLARTYTSGGNTDTVLPSSLLGSPHRYRIDWTATEEIFSVDGTVVATHARAIAEEMRPIASDLNVGGNALAVDWMRMTPYQTSGTFLSRVFDAGQPANWDTLSWNASPASGTSLAMSVRTGDTPTPDGTWTGFAAIPASGATVGANGRYAQYRAQPATTDAGRTPELQDVTLSFSLGSDTTPPTVASVTPADGATHVATSTEVTATFSEAMSDVTIGEATFTLIPQGGSPVAATVTYDAGTMTATLHPTAALAEGTAYTATIGTGVADQAGNHPATAYPWSFTTVAQSLTDTTVADFTAGTPGPDTIVRNTTGGEVELAPTVGAEFSGSTLPGGWDVTPWTGGTATVLRRQPERRRRPGRDHGPVRAGTLGGVRGHLRRNRLRARRAGRSRVRPELGHVQHGHHQRHPAGPDQQRAEPPVTPSCAPPRAP